MKRNPPTSTITQENFTQPMDQESGISTSTSSMPKPSNKQKKVLIVPQNSSTTAIQELEACNLRPQQYGITRRVLFSSGAALLQCSSTEQAEILKSHLAQFRSQGKNSSKEKSRGSYSWCPSLYYTTRNFYSLTT